jgi:hypothetical protein
MSYSDFTQPPMNCCAAVNVAVGSNAPFCPAVCYFSLPPTADMALHSNTDAVGHKATASNPDGSQAPVHAQGRPYLTPSTDLGGSVTMGEIDAAEGAEPSSRQPTTPKSNDAHVAFQASVSFDLLFAYGCVRHFGVGGCRISSGSSEGNDRISR